MGGMGGTGGICGGTGCALGGICGGVGLFSFIVLAVDVSLLNPWVLNQR
jgi:hypothetical protein